MHVPPREKEDAEMNQMMRYDNDYWRAVVIYLRSSVQIEVLKEKWKKKKKIKPESN
jgi:hypothetical protein